MSLIVRLLDRTDSKDYEALCRRSFAAAQGFTVLSSSLVWTPTDDAYPVLGAFLDGRLIASMRIEWIETLRELNFKAHETIEEGRFEFPLGYLAKASTDPQLAGAGYNSLLRYHSFLIMKYWSVHSILGFMVEGSPRVFSMKEMGYRFTFKKNRWVGNFESDSRVLFAELPVREKLDSAIQYLTVKIQPLLNSSQILFDHNSIVMKLRAPISFPGLL